MPVVKIDSQDSFNAKIGEAGSKLVMIDFYADWCGPCRNIAPLVETLSNSHDIVVLKVNVDDCETVTTNHEIKAMPTFVFYKNGKEVYRFSGASKEKLEGAINAHK